MTEPLAPETEAGKRLLQTLRNAGLNGNVDVEIALAEREAAARAGEGTRPGPRLNLDGVPITGPTEADWRAFEADESKWAKDGSGMTREQKTGATMYHVWLRRRLAPPPPPAEQEPVRRDRLLRQHQWCVCPDKVRKCVLHGASEYGGGEPDVCLPHEHRVPLSRPDATDRAVPAEHRLTDAEVDTIYAAYDEVIGSEARTPDGRRSIVEPIYRAVVRVEQSRG